MRRPLVAANWKMHGSTEFVHHYAEEFLRLLDGADDVVDVVIFPPAVYLPIWRQVAPNIACGLQDVGISPSGAHTGEIAAEMIRDVGGSWAITGHSERRIDQGEMNDLVATKAAAAIRAEVRPIVCVGETLDQRQAGHEIAVVEDQLEAVLDRLDIASLATGCIAYEPVWAIGTGETATPQQAQDMHAFIRDKIAHVDAEVAQQVRILYGGSVKPNNARELFSQTDIDGGLVGGAALDAAQFVQIIHAAREST